jgi:DNA-binding transcriptional ArsR family regulator
MASDVTLDLNSFIALASKSRISILKRLDEKCMTVTELSKTENLAKSTIYEHLGKLLDAGFVEKKEEGHKWIYYEITEKGRILLHPQAKNKILVNLSFSFLLLVCGFVYISRFVKEYLERNMYPPVEGSYDITFYLVVGSFLISLSVLLFNLTMRLMMQRKK